MRPMRPARAQHGFALVSAIFTLVILALLGGLILSLSNTQQISGVRDLLGTRAYYAARAGMEWGVYQALQASSCPASTALPGAVAATGFAVTVACSASGPYDEGGVSTTLYRITATAATGTLGQHDHAERQLQAVVSRP
jgi:MSHA biogenesis protein MshP